VSNNYQNGHSPQPNWGFHKPFVDMMENVLALVESMVENPWFGPVDPAMQSC
jgi:hypothetical protein